MASDAAALEHVGDDRYAAGRSSVYDGVLLEEREGRREAGHTRSAIRRWRRSLGRVTMEEVSRELWPFYAAMLLALLLVTYVPAISLWLPSLVKF